MLALCGVRGVRGVRGLLLALLGVLDGLPKNKPPPRLGVLIGLLDGLPRLGGGGDTFGACILSMVRSFAIDEKLFMSVQDEDTAFIFRDKP